MNEAPLLEGVSSGGWRDFYLQTRQTWPLAWFSSENSAMGLQWDATLCSVDHFLTFSRTVKMAMVSEFLGQLSLNIGVMSYLFYFIHYVQKIHSILFIFFFFHLTLTLPLIPQSCEPKYPTVVAALDFDPDRDAARIETAIKTKGKIQCWTCLLQKKKKKSVLGTETPLYRWVAGICESASWLKLFLTMLGTPPSLCLGAGRALLRLLATVTLPFSRPPFCNNEECVERCLFTNEVMREKVPCDRVMCRSKKTLLADTLLFMLSY